ncbi:unnamed protein product [Lymnaea stagnalis]|uniref:Uncharacterized protein n=1 Tax=Lymnaea stagnalis TaxID=6523 RepID=A0AAV2HSR6_LYMST
MTPIVKNKKKKIFSEVPSTIKESKINSISSKSRKSWDFTSLEGSPEKGRAVSFSKLSSNNLNLSPVMPAASSSSSPIPSINNSDSLLKLDGKELELPDPVNLFDSFRKDILKSAVPLASENSSELSAQTSDDDAEVLNAGSGSLREFIASKQKKQIPPQTELRDIMKSTSKVLQSSYESEQSRILEVKKFKDIIENVVGRMNKNLKHNNQSEVTLATLWTQHMEKLKNNRLTQEKELKQLRSAHEALKKNLGEAFSNGQNVKKTFKAALKQDIDALQRKHLAKVNAHSLDAMRRCFYANSLMFS